MKNEYKFDLNSKAGLICYCFNKSRAEVLLAIKNGEASLIVDEVKSKMKDPGCFCEKSNPSGKCCLKDFRDFIELHSK